MYLKGTIKCGPNKTVVYNLNAVSRIMGHKQNRNVRDTGAKHGGLRVSLTTGIIQ